MGGSEAREPLSHVLPPLVLGTATFNTQYHHDPTHMPYADIVRRALEHDVAAFDTSPYYGPSETLLGDALAALDPPPARDSYFLMTKAGRISIDEFDYSPSWIRYSVCRSLDRLGVSYLDLVWAHDVEFVSPAEVLAAVAELRRLRDRGLVRYVGISGYPVHVLVDLAEMVLEQTGEPLDAVMSYGHFCLQNTTLGRPGYLARFQAARVDCLLNASILGMGLLTSRGVDNGPMASWHPAPPALRKACAAMAAMAAHRGERLEEVAIRWALGSWARVGAALGTRARPSAAIAAAAAVAATATAMTPPTPTADTNATDLPRRIGVSVMGVAAVEELDETLALWRDMAKGADDEESVDGASPATARRIAEDDVAFVADAMWPMLGPWKDFAWKSGGETFTNRRRALGSVPQDRVAEQWGLTAAVPVATATASASAPVAATAESAKV